MKILPFFLALALSLLIWQCVTPFNPKIPALKSGVVIDGLVSDQPGRNRVVLSFTTEYTQNSLNLLVRDATVSVVDNNGVRIPFRETGPGYYEPLDAAWRGELGKSYTLSVSLSDGRRFQSTAEVLRPTVPIDSVFVEYTEKLKPGTLVNDKGFDVYLDVKDPAATKDYYRWTWVHYEPIVFCATIKIPECGGCQNYLEYSQTCCGRCWDIIRYFTPISIASDNAVNGNRISRQPILRAPYTSTTIYYVELEQQSLTEQAYQYLYTLNDLIKNTGGLFDAAPATLKGNISSISDSEELVFGFFTASAIIIQPLLIDRNTVNALPTTVYHPPALPPPSACIPCQESAFRTATPPKWWRF